MKIIGNRILVSKVEEEKKEGEFEVVSVQDSFVYKGKVEQGGLVDIGFNVNIGDTILFTKYSPDTQEVDYEGQKMKIIKVEDVLAVL